MTPSQKLARARNSVHVYCREQFSGETAELREAIYILDGFYRGRRFYGEKVTAIWFAEEDRLKIHSPAGQCIASWDAAEMDRQIQETGPATLPMRATQTREVIRRAA